MKCFRVNDVINRRGRQVLCEIERFARTTELMTMVIVDGREGKGEESVLH